MEFKITNSFESQGIFIDPINPTSTFKGTIIYKPGSWPVLKVVDGLVHNSQLIGGTPIPVVDELSGTLANGVSVRLLRGRIISSTGHTRSGIRESEYHFDTLLAGDEKGTDISKFPCTIDVQFRDIERWVNHDAFRVRSINNPIQIQTNEFSTIRWISTLRGITAECSLCSKCETDETPNKITINNEYILRIDPQDYVDISWIKGAVDDLSFMFSIMASCRILPICVHFEEPMKSSFDLIYNTGDIERMTSRWVHPYFQLLPRSALNGNPSVVLKRWFVCMDTFRPLFDGVASYLWQEVPFAELKLLILLQGLEAYTRRYDGYKHYDKATWSSHHKAAHDALKNAFHGNQYAYDVFNNSIKWANEYSLKLRLQTLLCRCPLSALPYISGDPCDTIRKAVKARNDISHRGGYKMLPVDDYLELANALLILSLLVILTDIGLTEGESIGAIKRFKRIYP